MPIKTFAAILTLLAAAALTPPAIAADLPEIKVTAANAVPACATPGRLMAFLRSRNRQLDPAFAAVATEYMRHGEALGVRWDYAFFQMLLETGNLTYTGDVRPDQNNFAGLGATGGVPGERFANVSLGVKAHLQHVLLYSGAHIDDPVAERTRKVQEWKVIDNWYKDAKGPRTFADLARRWAPGSRAYSRDISAIADTFYGGMCKGDDPEPRLVEDARRDRPAEVASTDVDEKATPQPAGNAPASKAKADNAKAGAASKGGLAGSSDKPNAKTVEAKAVPSPPEPVSGESATALPEFMNADAAPAGEKTAPGADAKVTILNPDKPETARDEAEGSQAKDEKGAVVAVNAGGAAQQAGAATGAAAQKPPCRVWTASYGGQKAIIIKAMAEQTVNYTVLDVNEGKEKREAEAYIAAYAKGGELVGGEFSSQSTALDKAFELCPEG